MHPEQAWFIQETYYIIEESFDIMWLGTIPGPILIENIDPATEQFACRLISVIAPLTA